MGGKQSFHSFSGGLGGRASVASIAEPFWHSRALDLASSSKRRQLQPTALLVRIVREGRHQLLRHLGGASDEVAVYFAHEESPAQNLRLLHLQGPIRALVQRAPYSLSRGPGA